MKTILMKIGGSFDFDVVAFEENSAVSKEELARIMYLDDNYKITHKVVDEYSDEYDIPVSIQVFEGAVVPKWFEDFVRNDVQDYDASKAENFYLFTYDELFPQGDVSDKLRVGSK